MLNCVSNIRIDLNKLLSCFPHLSLKEGYKLYSIFGKFDTLPMIYASNTGEKPLLQYTHTNNTFNLEHFLEAINISGNYGLFELVWFMLSLPKFVPWQDIVLCTEQSINGLIKDNNYHFSDKQVAQIKNLHFLPTVKNNKNGTSEISILLCNIYEGVYIQNFKLDLINKTLKKIDQQKLIPHKACIIKF